MPTGLFTVRAVANEIGCGGTGEGVIHLFVRDEYGGSVLGTNK
jgi:hypothetical protein